MSESLYSEKKVGSIRDLFSEFSEEQQREAEERLLDYLAFTVRMYDRIRSDPEAYARFKILTAERRRRKMEREGRLSSQ